RMRRAVALIVVGIIHLPLQPLRTAALIVVGILPTPLSVCLLFASASARLAGAGFLERDGSRVRLERPLAIQAQTSGHAPHLLERMCRQDIGEASANALMAIS